MLQLQGFEGTFVIPGHTALELHKVQFGNLHVHKRTPSIVTQQVGDGKVHLANPFP